MFYGSVVFLGTTNELRKITKMVDEELLLTNVTDISGPIDVELDRDGILYNMEFTDNQWISLEQLSAEIADIPNIEIIHALTDGATFIEVISTLSEYDDYEDSDNDNLADLASLYNLEFGLVADDLDEEDDDISDESEEDDYDLWN